MEKTATAFSSWKADLIIVASFLIAGIAFFMLGTIVKTNLNFMKGFLSGLGISGGLFSAIIIIRHLITGKNLVKMSDERIAFIKMKTSSQCFAAMFFALITIVFPAYTENPAFEFEAETICMIMLAGSGLLFGVLFAVNSRRY